ncbi:hypothetical protein Q9251_08085 [Alkalihalobacillus macyae]|uniref:hypothetical protein n=1 Tax=Guptibacillus hwajinpoensis TaxID=208199 RepID=UPI00273C6CFD|nr:hypothetical protein [Alkalihalobacillus macyae]MDP4550842.1 hypothetical protein [Alkalihalobacillus macyae]
MSEKKRKPKVIHVNKLIVKADEVIIHDERNHHKREEKQEEPREVRRDPWGFFGPSSDDSSEENEQSENKDQNEEASENDEPKGFSWF